MFYSKSSNKRERGASMVEFAIGGAFFFTVMFGVLELGRLLWVHNALVDATRRGARYAVLHPASSGNSSNHKVQNVVVCGTEADCTKSNIDTTLAWTNVRVNYSADYDVGKGTVTVTLVNDYTQPVGPNNRYIFSFITALVGTTLQLPNYTTTLTGESAGEVPPSI